MSIRNTASARAALAVRANVGVPVRCCRGACCRHSSLPDGLVRLCDVFGRPAGRFPRDLVMAPPQLVAESAVFSETVALDRAALTAFLATTVSTTTDYVSEGACC